LTSRRSAKAFARLYPLIARKHAIASRVLKRIAALEGGYFFSATVRALIHRHHGVSVGAYSYGPCLSPGGLPPGVTVGRYVSMAADVRVSLLNKPMDRLAMHPFFYEPEYNGGIESGIEYLVALVIEHDAWIGDSALILPGCRRIGLGAVVGGGSVVTRDVPDFAVVGGNPAKIIRSRFDEQTQELIRASRWWERSLQELRPFMSELVKPLGQAIVNHPLLTPPATAATAT
jgi:acetyltransferase-like isoleucine patch superfamily enzyme